MSLADIALALRLQGKNHHRRWRVMTSGHARRWDAAVNLSRGAGGGRMGPAQLLQVDSRLVLSGPARQAGGRAHLDWRQSCKLIPAWLDRMLLCCGLSGLGQGQGHLDFSWRRKDEQGYVHSCSTGQLAEAFVAPRHANGKASY
ncbi:hypothetical protein MAPG_03297 [Magnaporthiopsis poae ATCC 64411]|uniref:Uncharacterized protein n=1 Tax=Magnaporthiopsis poae (strain ATCC 64411 / 73-15) TaxID=644358 RepID=A0A0C4DTM6_MAGP6|nr:hypothetical protein MAPG_03297 [Magnaporthiopsis poae ATCC 64411]